MVSGRQRRLAHLSQANSQRRSLEALLSELSSENGDLLASAEHVFSPDTHKVLSAIFLARTDKGRPNYKWLETGWPDEVRKKMPSLTRVDPFAPAYLVLPEVEGIWYGNEKELVPQLPIFKLGYGQAARILSGIWRPRWGFCGVFSESLEIGFITDSYSGFPSSGTALEDCTYEVVSWGAA